MLGGLFDKYSVRYINNRLQDIYGNLIDPYEFTKSQFDNLVSADYAGIEVRITDVHQTAAGVGGVTFIGGSSWICTSPQIYYSTLAAGVAAFPAATYPGLRMVFGDVPGTPLLKSNGTRYVPESGIATLAKNVYGTVAFPTLNTGGGTAFTFGIGAPTIPANLFAGKDSIAATIRVKRHGAAAPIILKAHLGTSGDATDGDMYSQSIGGTDLLIASADILAEISNTSSYMTNSSNGKVSAGSVSLIADVSTNFNTTSPMVFSITGTKNTADTLDLLSYSLVWMAV